MTENDVPNSDQSGDAAPTLESLLEEVCELHDKTETQALLIQLLIEELQSRGGIDVRSLIARIDKRIDAPSDRAGSTFETRSELDAWAEALSILLPAGDSD
jgi:hypothetical protein